MAITMLIIFSPIVFFTAYEFYLIYREELEMEEDYL